MQLFYAKDISATGYCTLDAEESRHAVRVLRKREGDSLHVTDGQGGLYECRVVEASERGCVTEVIKSLGPAEAPALRRPRLHLVVAPTKNPSRMEWLVEKAVEVGVAEITHVQCDHSERTFLKTDRLQKIALSAMKQSLHLVLPAVNPVLPFGEWMRAEAARTAPCNRLIAHCEADRPRTPVASALTPDTDTVMLIGPEGDFSAEEIALAIESGFRPVSFGSYRLRTETAALYAVSAFNLINDR